MLDIVIAVVAVLAVSFVVSILMGKVFAYNNWLNDSFEANHLLDLVEVEIWDGSIDQAWALFKKATELTNELWVAPTDKRADEWIRLDSRLHQVGQDLYAQAEVMRS